MVALSPYADLFARAIASASSSTTYNDAEGPKVSSSTILPLGFRMIEGFIPTDDSSSPSPTRKVLPFALASWRISWAFLAIPSWTAVPPEPWLFTASANKVWNFSATALWTMIRSVEKQIWPWCNSANSQVVSLVSVEVDSWNGITACCT